MDNTPWHKTVHDLTDETTAKEVEDSIFDFEERHIVLQ